MEVYEAIKGRRSVRKYRKREVPKELVKEVIEAGIWAPSAGNVQDWRFILTDKEPVKKALAMAAHNQEQIRRASWVVVVCSDLREIFRAYGRRGVELYSVQDTAAATQNMLLRAHELGLGTCWIGAFDEGALRKILKLPGHFKPLAIIALGYPAEKPTSWRKPLEEVTIWL